MRAMRVYAGAKESMAGMVGEAKKGMVGQRWRRWRHLHINRRPAQAVPGNLDVTQREGARPSNFIKYNIDTVPEKALRYKTCYIQ